MNESKAGDMAEANRRVAKGIGATALARAGALVEIAAQPLYVLMFGLSGYGLYAVLWAAINLVENFFDLGMTSAMQRTVPRSANDAEAAAALRAAMIFGVGPCIAAAAIIAWQAPAIAPLINAAETDAPTLVPAIRIFVWTLPLWAFVEIATSALRARMLFGAEIRLRIVWEQVIRLGFAVLFFAAGFGLFGLFIAHICSLAITAFLCLRLLARNYSLKLMFKGPWWPRIAGDTVLAGVTTMPANIVARLFSDAPALAVNQLLPGANGAAAGGLFIIARKLSSVVQLVYIAFSYVLAPLASSSERRSREEVREIYAYAVRLIFVIAVPLAAVLAAGSGPLLSVFGRGAEVAQTCVVVLMIARAAEAVMGVSLPVLQVVAAFRHQLTASLIGLAVAALAGFLLVNRLPPLLAVTIAAAVALVVAAAVPLLQLWRFEALHPFTDAFPRVALVSLVATSAGVTIAWLAASLPDAAAIFIVLTAALLTVWVSARFALPLADRLSLGKAARGLRLVAPHRPS